MNSFYYSKYKKYKEKYKNLLGGSEECDDCGDMFCEFCAQKQQSDTKQPSGTKQQYERKQPFVTKQQSDEPNRLTINIIQLDGTTITIPTSTNPKILSIKNYIKWKEGIDVDDITLLDSNGVELPDDYTITDNKELQMVVDQISVRLDIEKDTIEHTYGLMDGYWGGEAVYIFNISDGSQIRCESKLLFERGYYGGRLDWDISPRLTNKKIFKEIVKILEDRGAKLLPLSLDNKPYKHKVSDLSSINSLYSTLLYKFGYLS